jgi:ELWxxDGT repeat protein
MDKTLFFFADDGVHGRELWKSDGTEAGTSMVKNIYPDDSSPFQEASSLQGYLTPLGSTLFFFANDGVHGSELWKSDGTEAGTTLVKDINPAGGSYFYGNLVALGRTLFFVADDGVHSWELWKSDGTEDGTIMVKDISPIDFVSGPSELTAVGNTLLFKADDGVHGYELWKSDGTEDGTLLVQDIDPGAVALPRPSLP